MNKPSNIVIAVFLILVIGISGYFYFQDDSLIISPQPEIYVDEISVSYHRSGCYVGFNLVNQDDIHAFIDVDISSDYSTHQNQYLIKPGTVTEKYIWVTDISADKCDEENVDVLVANIIKWFPNDDDVFLDE